MRSAAVTLLVGVAVAAAALIAAWSVQALALPHPERGDDAAINALAMLRRYRLVESTFRLDGGPTLHARCEVGWFPQRGTLLSLSNGQSLFAGPKTQLTPRAMAELELAGCPRTLPDRLENLVQNGDVARTSRAWTGQPALAIRIRARDGMFVLDVAPKRDIPVGLEVDGRQNQGSSRFRLVRLG